jgi:hypothetical protein
LALRHVSPDYMTFMTAKFKKDALKLAKNSATTTFFPKEIVVDEKNLKVSVTGTLSTFVGQENVKAHEHVYELFYVFNSGKFLQLKGFKLIKIDGKPVTDDDITAD